MIKDAIIPPKIDGREKNAAAADGLPSSPPATRDARMLHTSPKPTWPGTMSGFARQNEAAHAADASAWVIPAVVGVAVR
jgi:hypothetical protein